jgi:phosphatidylserine decarboxylase
MSKTKAISLSIISLVIIGLIIFYVYFNRNPKRKIAAGDNFVAISDGIIQQIQGNRIDVFIRLTDVHYQRTPCEGKIISIENQDNYFDKIVLQSDYGNVIMERRGGVLARSLVTNIKPGQIVEKGMEYGRIKLGSHSSITLPERANIIVKTGDELKAGETVIATV